jgi:hypothetical protein
MAPLVRIQRQGRCLTGDSLSGGSVTAIGFSSTRRVGVYWWFGCRVTRACSPRENGGTMELPSGTLAVFDPGEAQQ